MCEMWCFFTKEEGYQRFNTWGGEAAALSELLSRTVCIGDVLCNRCRKHVRRSTIRTHLEMEDNTEETGDANSTAKSQTGTTATEAAQLLERPVLPTFSSDESSEEDPSLHFTRFTGSVFLQVDMLNNCF